MMNKVTAAIAVIALALGASGLTFGIIEHNTVTAVQAQIAKQQHKARIIEAKVSAELHSLDNQVASLNVPSDPLSAYNQVCNQPMQNSYTGNEQTYYFPCTNQAQTTPIPGG